MLAGRKQGLGFAVVCRFFFFALVLSPCCFVVSRDTNDSEDLCRVVSMWWLEADGGR